MSKPILPKTSGYWRALFLRWAAHPRAVPLLAFISFIEASFFPIPPYAMLVPMCIANPRRAAWFAGVGTISSVLGGLLGYAIGYFAADWAKALFSAWGYGQAFVATEQFFAKWGALSILVSTISPLPYKVMTITSGLFGMNVVVFLLTSLAARGVRFYVAAFSTTKLTTYLQKRLRKDNNTLR
jgi:membrane protein YqaA with SNARE-associated domain